MDRLQQTICALATPPGTGGIAVVRVSGPDAYSMVEKIFVPLHVGRKVAEAKGYTAMLGHYLLHGQEMDPLLPRPPLLYRRGCHRAFGPRRYRYGGRLAGSPYHRGHSPGRAG